MTATTEHGHKALIFLMSIGELRRMFDDWPAQMHLAVCLKDDGECRMLVYREEEGARLLPRLRRVLGLRLSEMCFFPEQDGLPTRKLLYSDEKQLMALVRNAPEIVEEATDYSINYSFAVDEGLDPMRFLNTSGETQKPIRLGPVAAREGARPAREQRAVAAPKPVAPAPKPVSLPRFMQQPGPAVSAKPAVTRKTLPEHCVIQLEADGWIAIDLPGCVGPTVTISNPGRLFVRDDRRVIALHADLMGDDGAPLPGRLLLGVKYLPEGLRTLLERCPGPAKLSFENGFLFITPHRSQTVANPTAPTAGPLARLGSYWRIWAPAAAVIAVLMVGLQSVLAPPPAGETETGIDWSQFQTGAAEPEARGSGLFRENG